MSTELASKIVGFEVVKDDEEQPAEVAAPDVSLETMNEEFQRPEATVGFTYKVKPPVSDHAMYVTINDVILNQGTDHEQRRPIEIFINSKNMEHFQWMVALTRIISAVFRKGGDVVFLTEELLSVYDPKGGYFKKGGKYMPSLVAEIGDILKQHYLAIGLIEPDGLDEHQQKLIEEKRAQFEASQQSEEESDNGDYPEGAQLCNKCNTKAVVKMDGCMTCLACGDSKCG